MRIAIGRSGMLVLTLGCLLLGGCETRVPQLSDLKLPTLTLRELTPRLQESELVVYQPRRADEAQVEQRVEVAEVERRGEFENFLSELGKFESGGLTYINFTQPGNQGGYIGGWQFGEAALIDAGFYSRDGTPRINDWKGRWTGLKGVSSKREFLASPDAQWHAIKTLMPRRWAALQNMGLHRFVGETIRGVPVTGSGLLAASHLLGPGGVRDFLRSGGKVDPVDGNDTSASSYLVRFNGFSTPYRQPAMTTGATAGQGRGR